MIYAEGEDERVLRAAQVVVDEKLARPILIGRPEVVEMRIKRFGLRLSPGRDCELVNPESDTRYKEVWNEYYKVMRRRGVSPDDAKVHVRQSNTLIGAMLLRRGDGDALLCGTFGRHKDHLRHVANIIGLRRGSSVFAAMNVLMLPKRTVFISDTYVNEDPSRRTADRDHHHGRRGSDAASALRRRWRCFRTRISAPTILPRR